MTALRVIYQLKCKASEVKQLCRDIAFEQTVEVPERLVSDEILERVVGKVASIQPVKGRRGLYRATVEYAAELSGWQVPQFFNLIYGNISLKPAIRVLDVEFPEPFLKRFRGPNWGIEGIRRRLGVFGRPLLASAIKPRGSSVEHFANVARGFAQGGGDIIKDDHNLQEERFEDWRERILRCHQATLEAGGESGRPTFYLPNLIGSASEIERQAELLMREGVPGALVSPFVVGMETFRHLAENYPLIYMVHPTFTGAFFNDPYHGIAHGLFLGTFFRLLGADSSVFPNYGGRFTFSREDCHDICDRLRTPMGDLKPALPAPAGGMKFENIVSMSDEYGEETIFLIGGALIGHAADMREGTAAFLAKIKERFEERIETPDEGPLSVCELPGAATGEIQRHLPFVAGQKWQGRQPDAYKQDEALPFKDVTRWELIGKHGERTAFDLRYFEIAPGGYSSLEKHLHTHTIICVRGRGVLDLQDERIELNNMDIAYVEPMRVHQLSNHGEEPFGFFCLVDHERDRPMAP